MDRIERIKSYSTIIKKEETEQTKAKLNLKSELISNIQALQPRIEKIIYTANVCYDNGIDVENSGSSIYCDYDGGYEKGQFLTEGIYHRVGIVKQHPYECMGITNGGACGIYDFRTNGIDVFSLKNNNSKDNATYEPQIKDMQNFLNNFDVFEKAFYEYIDKTLDEKVPNEEEPDITDDIL